MAYVNIMHACIYIYAVKEKLYCEMNIQPESGNTPGLFLNVNAKRIYFI